MTNQSLTHTFRSRTSRFLAPPVVVGTLLILTLGTSGRPNAQEASRASAAPLRVETFVSGLDTPWDLAWGPDGAIWVTERPGTISRVDAATGEITRVGHVDVVEVSESGLMGIAFHPDFASQPYVYVAHSYGSGRNIRNRLVRMRFDGTTLGEPQVLLDGIPGAGNHNGSRLAIGPDRFLYMTTGDAGRGARAQNLSSVAGKVLRLTLDGRPAPGNPFGTLVYSYGHRNARASPSIRRQECST